MTIAFHCSACPVLLKVADTAAGKKCKCPKCGTMNDIPAPADEAEEVEEVEEAPRKVTKSKAAIAPEPAVRPKKKAKPVYDDDDEPAADDDEPEEEVRPRKGKKSKGKKGKKGGKKGLLIGGGIALGVLFLLCAGGGIFGALWYFGGGVSDDYYYYPNNTEMVRSMRVSDVMASQVYKDAAASAPMGPLNGLEKQAGIPLDNIDRFAEAGPRGGSDPINIVHTKNTVQAADIEKKMIASNAGLTFKETTVGKFTLHEPTTAGPGRNAFCVVNGKTVVYGSPTSLKNVLERNKKVELSTGMQAALQKTDFRSSVTTVQSGGGGLGGPPGLGGGFPGPGGGTPSIENSIEEVNFGSTDMTSRSTITYKDAKGAEAGKKERDAGAELLKLMPNGKDITMTTTVSGNVLTVETKVPGSFLKNMR